MTTPSDRHHTRYQAALAEYEAACEAASLLSTSREIKAAKFAARKRLDAATRESLHQMDDEYEAEKE